MDAAGDVHTATMDASAAPLSPASPHDASDPKPTTETVEAKPANALTPPTSEEMNNEPAQDDSELSDLDMSDDDGEEVVPDHYWDDGKIPVFKPTMDQFRSFKKYVEKIDKYGMKSGIVKVIPPKEWRDGLQALDEMIKHIKIKNPITQEFNGTLGTYTQQNVEKQRSYNLPEWKALTEETQYQPPARRGERRRTQKEVVRGGGALRGRAAAKAKAEAAANDEEPEPPKEKRKPGRPRRNAAPVKDEGAGSDEEPTGKRAARGKATPTPAAEKSAPKKRGRAPGGGAGAAKSVTSRRLNNTMESADYVDEKAFKNFDYHMDGLDEFTPERCAELETAYWKSLGFNQPMYAADMPGSLFDERTESWNVAKLENLLDVLGTKVPGVNTAYLYLGMWKATFAWHLEDVDLYSINYIHFGAPKQWYSISQEDARRFEKAMKSVWPQDAKGCDQFLRHKTYLISPDVLQKQYNVKVNKLVHYEGEFVITYPYGYHSGYNLGYNCAESVNFATESWLDFGRIARKCNCEADNVWVDVSEIERKMRGEPTPEYYEETDDDSELGEDDDSKLPTPPASVKGRPSKKRKRDVKQEVPKKKKKIRIRIKAPTREPCVMCPNDNPWEPLLQTDNGKMAHRSCAIFTPETYIVNRDGKEIVCGVTGINRARLELKCNFCRSKRGACFQCSGKKCARAFHATCALAAGVQVDAGPVPTFGEDGTEYFEEGFDFRCKMHRPKMPKNATVEMLENTKRTMVYARELKPNDVVQAQLIGREVFAGLVIENRPAEMTVLVDVLPEGDRVEVDWKWLCVLDPDDSQRPKPSSTAIPMPEGMNKQLVSMSNRQDGVPTQEEVFTDNPEYKWQEFYNMETPPQGYVISRAKLPKVKVDIDKADQLYYYLPQKSTEARCFFTDKVGGKDHAPKSNFLDRVAPPKPRYEYSEPGSLNTSLRPGNTDAQYHKPEQRAEIAKLQALQPQMLARKQQQQPPPSSLHTFPRTESTERPYNYKPRTPAQPNMLAIDTQALANQQKFTAQAQRKSSYGSLFDNMPPAQDNPFGREPSHSSSGSGTTTPLRPFSQDQYYSNRVLPAAVPGEYSNFRRVSQGAQTMQRPNVQHDGMLPNYRSVSQQKTDLRRQSINQAQGYAPPTAMMGGSVTGSAVPSPYGPQGNADQYNHSPYSAPSAVMQGSTPSSKPRGRQVSQDYLDNLRKYPYLLNSFLRKHDAYQSPYPLAGGFSADCYEARTDNSGNDNKQPVSAFAPLHTPKTSISSTNGDGQQWTPPSQRPGAPMYQGPSQLPAQANKWPSAIHQTPQEFRQQLQHTPSIASRDGVQQRMLRDKQGYTPYMHPSGQASAQQPPQQRNSFGQPYDPPSHVWVSPKAPTASPISDTNTPGMYQQQQYNATANAFAGPQWGMQNLRADFAPMTAQAQRASVDGKGPMLPQMEGGHETWRYGN